MFLEETVIMNDLPVSRYRAMCKELWDRQGANIANRWKEMYSEKLFPCPKTGIFGGRSTLITIVLSQNAENVHFVSITMKYVTKSTDKLICLRNVYFEIYIM